MVADIWAIVEKKSGGDHNRDRKGKGCDQESFLHAKKAGSRSFGQLEPTRL